MDQIRRGTSLRRARSTSDRSSPHFKHWEITKYGAELFFQIFSFLLVRMCLFKKGSSSTVRDLPSATRAPYNPPIPFTLNHLSCPPPLTGNLVIRTVYDLISRPILFV
jgi:hypothetical protein